MGSGFLVGGLASSRARYAQIADSVVEGGLSGVLFSADVPVSTRLSQGCSPIGTRHQVTSAEENLIIELDGRAALDVLKEDVGEVLARDLRKVAGYIFVGLPVQGADTGDYLVRNLMGLDPVNGIIAVGEQMQVGSSMLFCRRDGRSAVDDLRRMLAELKATLKEPPKGGIYCTCIGRGINLFGGKLRRVDHDPQRAWPLPSGRLLRQRRNLAQPIVHLHRGAQLISMNVNRGRICARSGRKPNDCGWTRSSRTPPRKSRFVSHRRGVRRHLAPYLPQTSGCRKRVR